MKESRAFAINVNLLGLFEVGVPEDRLEECYRWAFGDDYAGVLV